MPGTVPSRMLATRMLSIIRSNVITVAEGNKRVFKRLGVQ
jgi:hypothetical protein